MELYSVKRKDGDVIVTILKHKEEDTYSFVNITKGHICPCKFASVEDAVNDLEYKKTIGELEDYKLILKAGE